MSTAEEFTLFDFGKRGYKILVILYDRLGFGLPIFADSLLKQSYCFVNKTDYIYDLAPNEMIKKRQRNKIIENIREGFSPIIIDNVNDLLSAKPFCEIAVECGYMIEIVEPPGTRLSKPREELFTEFGLRYKQEVPQLRQHPSIPIQMQGADDTDIKNFIRSKYVFRLGENANQEKKGKNFPKQFHPETVSSKQEKLYMDEMVFKLNAHTATTINAETFGQTAKAENIIKDTNVPKQPYQEKTQQAFDKSIQAMIKKKFEANDDTTDKTIRDFFKEIKDYNENQSKLLFNDIKDLHKRYEETNNTIMRKMEDVSAEIRSYNKNQMKLLSEFVEQQLTAFVKSQDDANRKLKEQVTIQTLVPNKTNFPNDEALETIQKPLDKSSSPQETKNRHPKAHNVPSQKTESNNDEYEDVISHIKAGLKVMILMRGLPGSGKSYLASKLLEDTLGAVDRSEFIFDPLQDILRKDSFKSRDLEKAHLSNVRKCFAAVKRGVSPVIVDSTNLQIEDMKLYCLMGVQQGYIIEIIEMNTPWATNVPVLAKMNSLRLDRDQIQIMLENYQRNISSSYLLKKLDKNYQETLPQLRNYPPLQKPKENEAEDTKKPREVARDHVHKSDAKYTENDIIEDVPEDQENNSAKPKPLPKPKENVPKLVRKPSIILGKHVHKLNMMFEKKADDVRGLINVRNSQENISDKYPQMPNPKENIEVEKPTKDLSDYLRKVGVKYFDFTKENISPKDAEEAGPSPSNTENETEYPSIEESLDTNQIILFIQEGCKVLLLMRGLPGSGKTTLASSILYKGVGEVNRDEFIFSINDYFKTTGLPIGHDADDKMKHAILRNQRKCYEAMKRGVSPIIIDDDNLEVNEMRLYCTLATMLGYIIEIVEPQTPWALDTTILADRNSLGVDEIEIQRMLTRFQQNVTVDDLKEEFKLSYKDDLPQFRKYPPIPESR